MVLYSQDKAKERSKSSFKGLLNENPRVMFEDGVPNKRERPARSKRDA